jgi:uncharacterized protein
MNPQSEASRKFAVRSSVAVLVLLALTLPIVALGVHGALKSNSNDPRQWLPRGFEETKKYLRFHQHFGRDEISVATWPGCTLDDGRVERLAAAMVGPNAKAGPKYFDRVITGPRILDQLTSKPLQLPRREAIRRLQGTLIGPNDPEGSGQNTTCVVLVISELGLSDRVGAVEQIRQVAQTCGISPNELKLGGPTVDAATIDMESQRLLLELSGLSALIAMFVTWWRFRSFKLTVIMLAGAVYCTGATLSALYYSGGNMNLVMTMLPPLIYVLSISAAVHLVNYYRDAREEGDPDTAPMRAMAHGWRPCLLASATTAIGLLSLSVSKIVPIQNFGIYSAVGMGITIVVLFLFLPAVLTVWRPEIPARKSSGAARRDPTARIVRFHLPIAGGSILLMIGMGCGLFRLESTVKLQHRFAPGSRILQDYAWMEKNLGPLVPLEVVIGFDAESPLDFFGRMEFVADLEENIRRFEYVEATMSAADFAPVFPRRGSTEYLVKRPVAARQLVENRQSYVDADFLSDNGTEELWRISVRVNALSDVDYGFFIETLKAQIDPIVSNNPHRGISATYTGVIPLIYKAQRQLFNDLVRSFLLAFGVIALVMVIALRSPAAGLLAMAPNLFPAVMVFGFMGWTGQLIEIGSVMTASAALGIAVDDTFHFLTWFRRGSAEGMSRRQSLSYAYRRCADAMIHTTIICSSALVVFSLSTFMPVVHFAWLMVTLLIAALIGDLVFLPAMLAGPAGRAFQSKPDTPAE